MNFISPKVLVVGHGSIGRRHLRLVRESLPAADIAVLRHAPGSPVPEFANSVLHTLEAALAFAPTLAVVANPAPFHLPVAQALIASGCHVLIEKPLAAELSEQITEFLELARVSGVVCMVGYNLRFLPSLQAFRQQVLSGIVGRVFSVRCEIGQYLPSWRPESNYRQGVSARAELGGGVLLELSHELDYLRWIFGEVQWVSAWTGRLGGLDIEVEDTAHLTLGLGSSLDDEKVVALNMDFARRDTVRTCVAIGTAGSLKWNALDGSVCIYEAGASDWRQIFCHRPARDESYVAQWQQFLAAVDGGALLAASGEDGLAVLKVIDAARCSACNSGARVDLSEQKG